MIVDFSFLSFSSLKSFCAPRHTPKVSLCGIVASLRSSFVVYLQALGDTQRGGGAGFSFLDLLFHMDMLSRYWWVASYFVRYIPIFKAKTIVPPWGVSGSCQYLCTPPVFTSLQLSSYLFLPTAIKLLILSIFMFYIFCSNLFLKFLNKCSQTTDVRKLAEVEEG